MHIMLTQNFQDERRSRGISCPDCNRGTLYQDLDSRVDCDWNRMDSGCPHVVSLVRMRGTPHGKMALIE